MSGLLIRRPALLSVFSNVIAAESTRHGGVSPAPYDSLNLGIFTDDDPENVRINRLRFFTALGVDPNRVVAAHQVHSDTIHLALQPGLVEGYDALITSEKDLFLTVTAADCTPVLILDPVREACAAVHAGWRGASNRIVAKTVEAMQRHFDSDPTDCWAYVGTCIDASLYEVGEDVADEFETQYVHPTDKGKYLLDLKAANRDQLQAAGLPHQQIALSPFGTISGGADYFSHRAHGPQTGRMVAGIGIYRSETLASTGK